MRHKWRLEAARTPQSGGTTPTSEQSDGFYAQRVADYMRALAVLFGGLYVMGAIGALIFFPERFWAIHTHPAKIAHLAVPIACFGCWLALKRTDREPWVAPAVDVAIPIGTSLVVAALSRTVPAGYGLYLLPLMVAALLLVLRAALVPSPPARTVIIGLLVTIPTVWAAWTFAAHEPSLPAPMSTTLVAAASAGWCLGISGLTGRLSQTIYGLHRDVAHARRLGQYVLGDLIGEGGMGAVYRGEHAFLRRPTAIKLLLPDRAGPENIARFEREVQLTAGLTHPNTVAIYDYGRTADGSFYYAMELLDGLTLEDLVRRYGPQPAGRIARILRQVAGALGEAHGLGLIHRDVKPANIILCQRGGIPDVAKLLDFGLVKAIGAMPSPSLTIADGITGTPQYLAPEAILDPGKVDHEVDVYAWGCVGYFLATGEPVFRGHNLLEVCAQHLNAKPTRPSERLGRPVPHALEALILQCLAKDPRERPKNAAELKRALAASGLEASWPPEEAEGWWREHEAQRSAPPPISPGLAHASANRSST